MRHSIEDAGLRISCLHPYIGASPDAHVSCDCCGTGILEVKCPFCAKDSEIGEAVDNLGKKICLERLENGTLSLRKEHSYYYQVQLQLYVTASAYCDFVVWTEKDADKPFVQRILPDAAFIGKQLPKAKLYFLNVLLPELIAKYYTAPKSAVPASADVPRYCYCIEPEFGNMLECKSGFCKIKRFHQSCLGVLRKPKSWLCPCCRKLVNKQKKSNVKGKQMKP